MLVEMIKASYFPTRKWFLGADKHTDFQALSPESHIIEAWGVGIVLKLSR